MTGTSRLTDAELTQCPEAILLDGERVLQCAGPGGHEGDHQTAPFDHGEHEGVTATWSVSVDVSAVPPF